MYSLQELADKLGDWLYRHGPSPETETAFFVTILGTGIVILLIEFLRPYIRVANERRYEKHKLKLKEKQKFLQTLQSLKWPPKSEEERNLVGKALRELVKLILWIVAICLIVGVFWFWKAEYIDKDFQESTTLTETSIRQQIEQFDEYKKRLWQKVDITYTNMFLCEDESVSQRRTRVSVMCRERAHLLAGNARDEIVTEYRLCMIDNGWRTRQCGCNEENKECTPLFEQSGDCNLVQWKTHGPYLGTECMGYVPRKTLLGVHQSYCNEKASVFGVEKAPIATKGRYSNAADLLTHHGSFEFNRLSRTIITYKMCMREKGWSVLDCPKEEIGSKECYEVLFVESLCQTQTRKWSSGETDGHLCMDKDHWMNENK